MGSVSSQAWIHGRQFVREMHPQLTSNGALGSIQLPPYFHVVLLAYLLTLATAHITQCEPHSFTARARFPGLSSLLDGE